MYEDTIGFCVTPYKYEKFDPDEKINLVKNHDIIKTIHILAFALNEGEVVVREYQFEIDFNNDFDSTYNDLALMDRNIFKEFAKRVPYLSYNEYCKAKSQYNVE
ncbi:MAG: hypothetical protein GX061_04215 [Eubacteriaceae bacterium]|nr:hypothetical protein [Eubacteriaceae bacterium]